MIVDYFPFFSEYGEEILKLRINLLKDHVDYFVISESNKTHMGGDTPLVFNSLIEKLNLPKEKIIYIENIIQEESDLVITDIDILNSNNNVQNLKSIKSKLRDRLQKDALLDALHHFDEDTVFIHSDMDEIINPDVIKYFADVCRNNQDIIIKVPLVLLEGRADLRVHDRETEEPYDFSRSMFFATKRQLKKATPTQIRSNCKNPFPIQYILQDGKRLEDLGWHFSWMGGQEIRKRKVEAWAHSDDQFDFLFFGSYNNDEYKKFITRNVFKDGDLPPSGNKYQILRSYDISKLPKMILEDRELRKFFLPVEYNQKELANIRTKLDKFPNMNILSTDDAEGKNRTDLLSKLLHESGVNYKINSVKRYKDRDTKISMNGIIKDVKDLGTEAKAYSIFTNHMDMIRDWYENTEEDIGFFCEDDISFETVKYWDFKWTEFIQSLPEGWDIVQLCVVTDYDNLNYSVNLEKKFNGHFWGVNAYIVSRNYAKKLIDEYCTDEKDLFKVHFKYELTNPVAIPEDLMYTLNNKQYYLRENGVDILDIPGNIATGFYYDCNNILVKPLFIENLDFKYDAGLDMHSKCHEYTLSLWKKIHDAQVKHKVVIVTGGFDPIHSGHIEYFKEAKKLGDVLIVGVNSDEWLVRKKGQQFMNLAERVNIIKNLVMVDSVITFDDSDGTAKSAIRQCLDLYPESEIIFANGGDRTKSNISEMELVCSKEETERLKFKFSVGGSNKMNSSSKILTEWKTPRTERKWGYYRVLHSDGPSMKVKELVVEPGKSLSLQKHNLRSEYWIVSEGTARVNYGENPATLTTTKLEKHDDINIPVGKWHQLVNETDKDLRIVEVQYGINCIEEDITRI